MKNTIKRLLKEQRSKKFTDKFLITTFKMIDKWLQRNGHDVDELRDDWSVYEKVLIEVLQKMGVKEGEDEEYIIASFVTNFMSAGDWDFLIEMGISEPQKKQFTLTKTYGMNAVVSEETSGEGYLPSEMFYGEMNYGLDWDHFETDVRDTWDTEYDISED